MIFLEAHLEHTAWHECSLHHICASRASLSEDPEARKLFDIFLKAWFDFDGQEAGESAAEEEEDPELDPESLAALADGEAVEGEAVEGEGVDDFGLQSRITSMRHVRSHLIASACYMANSKDNDSVSLEVPSFLDPDDFEPGFPDPSQMETQVIMDAPPTPPPTASASSSGNTSDLDRLILEIECLVCILTH